MKNHENKETRLIVFPAWKPSAYSRKIRQIAVILLGAVFGVLFGYALHRIWYRQFLSPAEWICVLCCISITLLAAPIQHELGHYFPAKHFGFRPQYFHLLFWEYDVPEKHWKRRVHRGGSRIAFACIYPPEIPLNRRGKAWYYAGGILCNLCCSLLLLLPPMLFAPLPRILYIAFLTLSYSTLLWGIIAFIPRFSGNCPTDGLILLALLSESEKADKLEELFDANMQLVSGIRPAELLFLRTQYADHLTPFSQHIYQYDEADEGYVRRDARVSLSPLGNTFEISIDKIRLLEQTIETKEFPVVKESWIINGQPTLSALDVESSATMESTNEEALLHSAMPESEPAAIQCAETESDPSVQTTQADDCIQIIEEQGTNAALEPSHIPESTDQDTESDGPFDETDDDAIVFQQNGIVQEPKLSDLILLRLKYYQAIDRGDRAYAECLLRAVRKCSHLYPQYQRQLVYYELFYWASLDENEILASEYYKHCEHPLKNDHTPTAFRVKACYSLHMLHRKKEAQQYCIAGIAACSHAFLPGLVKPDYDILQSLLAESTSDQP